MPEELAYAYAEAYQKWKNSSKAISLQETDAFISLDRFWSWCSLNPNAESREDLFKFLKHHNMQITKQGMFLAYRRVVSKNTVNAELIRFISSNYILVKGFMRKEPANFIVMKEYGTNSYLLKEDEDFDVDFDDESPNEFIGYLDNLYLDLPILEQAQFTDNHTHTMDYRIGVEARIERNKGNQSNQVSCSKGLHVASKAYDYSGFGDTAILVAVNPMDVLAVPQGENGKLRTCAFTPVSVLSISEENNILDNDFNTDAILFKHYENQVLQLKELMAANTAYELTINHILYAPSQTILNTILTNIEHSQEVINNRTTYLF